MWIDNKLTVLLKISLPIIQAPMAGGATSPELVAAVSNAGALGSLAAGYLSPEQIKQSIKKIRQLTIRPFSVNLFVPHVHHATSIQIEQSRHAIELSCRELNFRIPPVTPPFVPAFKKQINVLLEEKIPIVSFTFGLPSQAVLKDFRQHNIPIMGTATTLKEAQWLEQQAVDVIVAQSKEAGGHRATFLGEAQEALTPLPDLLSSLAKYIQVPIIASGGIMNARNIVHAFELGADAVQMGTAFLCCHESQIHPLYKKLLLTSMPNQTVLTHVFSGKMARGLRNTFIQRMEPYQHTVVDYPIQHALTTPMRQEAQKQDRTEFMSLWAGENAYLCQSLPVKNLIYELQNELKTLL